MEEVAELSSLLTAFFVPLIVIIVLLFLAKGSLYVVKQQTNYIIERFGKFHKVSLPGLRIKIPIVDRIAKKVPLRIMQLDSVVETKTKDNAI